MAYYINLYNAYFIQFIGLKHPIDSPKTPSFSGNDIWNFKLVKVANKRMTLNDVQHKLQNFKDPRIHFAINCGAKSCPRLMDKAWTAKTLDTDLTRMTMIFINDLSSNIIKEKKIKISKIFEWYLNDFTTPKTTLIDFINKYSKIQISPKAKIEYLPYNWKLNE